MPGATSAAVPERTGYTNGFVGAGGGSSYTAATSSRWVRLSPPVISVLLPSQHHPEAATWFHPYHPGSLPEDFLASLLRDLSFWESTRAYTSDPTGGETPIRTGATGISTMTSLVPLNNNRFSAPHLLQHQQQSPSAFEKQSSWDAPLFMYSNGIDNEAEFECDDDGHNDSYLKQQCYPHEEKKVQTSMEEATAATRKQQQQKQQRIWKAAVDPTTGRTYYYDAITRKTQWEKPDEIRTEERRLRKEKRRLDQVFFDEVKRNILSSLSRGELIPGIPRELTQTFKQHHAPVAISPLEEYTTQPEQQSLALVGAKYNYQKTATSTSSQQQAQRRQPSSTGSRIRTISGMNEKVLAELQDTTTPATLAASVSSSSSTSSSPTTTTALSLNSTPPRSNAPSYRQATTAGVATAAPLPLPTIEGRPPLPQRGRSIAVSGAVGGTVAATTTTTHHRDCFATQDSLELSPDQPSEMAMLRKRESSNELLQGEHLLDEPIWENGGTSMNVSGDLQLQVEQQQQQPQQISHVRRNTGGTVFVQSTMENPDINATIKCVVAVYRAHIVQAAHNRQLQQQQQQPNAFEIFRDETSLKSKHGVSTNKSTTTTSVPSLEEIESFYHDFFRRSQMEHDTIIMSLIYAERLIKETNGALVPAPHNWKSVLFSCMVLSSKVWDDLSMFNLDFSNVSMACGSGCSSSLSAFSLQRTNALELAVLQTLNFNVRVAASEYAKYYFLIRTMLLRSGLLDEQRTSPKNISTTPPNQWSSNNATGENNNINGDVWGGQLLENRSSQYQDSLVKRRAKSVDWTLGTTSPLVIEQPMLRDTVCLEQLLLCNQQHRS